MKTSLGIWAMGPMVTRFNPGGYKPELAGASTAEHVRTAVAGLEGLIDDYEFHYPQELSRRQPRRGARGARRPRHLRDRAAACTSTSASPAAGCRSPDDAIRDEAREAHARRARTSPASLGARMIIWPGIEGYNYPFQTPYAESWARLIDGIGEAAARLAEHGQVLFLEHKNSEPAMKIHMGNVGMTLHVIHTLRARGIDNVQVNMDWQHLIMNGENLAEYAALLHAEGLLGHQHANSGWGTFDDDNMVGATAFMETLELAVELRRAGYGTSGERLGFDLYPYTEDAVEVVKRSVLQWRFIDGAAGAHRRRGAARGAARQGRDPRVRARVRGARRSCGAYAARLAARWRCSPGWTSGPRRSRGCSIAPRTARSSRGRRSSIRCRRRGPAGPSRTRRTGGPARRRCSRSSARAGRDRRDRADRPDARPGRARRRPAGCCARRSSGTTAARARSARRSRPRSAWTR